MSRARLWFLVISVSALGALVAVPSAAAAPISLTGPYGPETFDSLAITGTTNTTGVPAGWEFAETGVNANTSYAAGTGSDNAGNTYSYGSAGNTERAFGQLRSGNLISTIGASFTNNTGSAITSLDVASRGEQWRLGTNTAGRLADRMDFQYSTDATSLTTGTWIDVNSLDFSGPTVTGTVGALNGNAAPNFTSISNTITGLSIANGATFYIRWTDIDATSSDDGLAIDDFSLTPQTGTADTAPTVSSTIPGNGATGVATNANITITFSEPVNVSGSWFTISCGTSGSHTATVSGGPTTFTVDPSSDFGNSESCSVNIVATQVTDQDTTDPPDAMAADYPFSFTTTAPPGPATEIHQIQGASHISPLNGQAVSGVDGIVTALRTSGFYLEDTTTDADPATSAAIFVFTSSAPTVSVGDSVLVAGTVTEFRPGGSSGLTNLTTTEITGPTISVVSTGNPLPAPTVIGVGGRVPPTEIIEDDAMGDVETSGVFDPATDGIDFYESLEGMLVRVNSPVAVGPTNDFGEIPVLADDGAAATVRTARGGIVIRPSDFNPERIILDDGIVGVTTPAVNVGDHFSASIDGVIDYSFGNFKLFFTVSPTRVAGALVPESTAATLPGYVSIATFNVENLDPADAQSKFDALAAEIVTNLKVPDVVALEEIQDNDGPTNSSVVAADLTYQKLIDAIVVQGGPTYQFRQVDPVDDQDGGEPGGNIRVGFIFRTDRGLAFVDKPGAGPTTPNAVQVPTPTSGVLVYSPGRIDPANAAFLSSRKPLAAELTFNGQRIYLIANHFNSKGGDQPLFGHFQPPTRSSETQRHQQATIVRDFVNQMKAADPDAQVVVLGDINDFEFSQTVTILEGAGLTAMMDTLPESERYSYVFEGNSQSLDHILVTNPILFRPRVYDVVHVNSEFAAQISDHDPQVLQYDPKAAATAVQVRSFTAARAGRSVVLRWRTGSIARILGFNIYREQAGRRVRLNRSPLVARGSRSYAWRDRRAPMAPVRYWLQAVRPDGGRSWVGQIRVR